MRITTGQSAFQYGVDSSRVPLIQSEKNPDGLNPNGLAWLVNGGTRGGGITPRFGYNALCKVHDGNALYQGGILYDNSFFGGHPYLMLSVGGRMLQVRVDTDNSVVDVTGAFADPPDIEKCYWTQGERFAIKQAGDGITLPLFWDGLTLRRSNGFDNNQGVTSLAFNTPAVGIGVLVTLTAPFTGPVNQVLQIWDPLLGTPAFVKYVQVEPDNFYTIKNIAAQAGATIPAGNVVKFADGSIVGVLLAPFVVPAIGANVNVKITPAYTGPALPVAIVINGTDFEIQTTGAAAPGPNQVYLVNLTNSAGVGDAIPASTTLYSTKELPAAQSMVYYMNRIWYAQNDHYTAGDIVKGSAGTPEYNFKDSILKVTENPLAVGGDGFSLPGQEGNVRALNYPTALDTVLGQGPLFVFTPKAIYSLVVPITRADWIAADSDHQPLQRVVMRNNGTVSDRSVVPRNGDLFFQAIDPSIRSFFMALRYFGNSWGNPPISANIERVMKFQDRGLMHMASGMAIGERVYQTVLPFQTPVGVAFKALAVLDTDPVSTLQDQKPPVWDGIHSGLDMLQVFSGDFGGLQRAFAVTHNRIDGSIWVYELTSDAKFDDDDKRVEWWFETPAFDWSEYPREYGGGAFEIKELDGLDIWMDSIFGEVIIKVQYRPDEDQCWYDWNTQIICAARTCAEDPTTPNCYPVGTKSSQYRMPISLPKPTSSVCSVGNSRPVTWGGKFQLKFTIKGWGRFRGFALHALPKKSSPYNKQVCTDDFMPRIQRQIVPGPSPVPGNGIVLGNPNTGTIIGNPNTGEKPGIP